VTGVLSPANETDLYQIVANAGDIFNFDSQALTNTDAYWRLIDPLGGQVFFTGMSTDVSAATLPVAGAYTLMLEGRRHSTTGTNDYRFAVQFVGNAPSNLAGDPIALDSLITGAISANGEIDTYLLTLAADKRIVVDALSDTPIQWTLAGERGVIADRISLQGTDSSESRHVFDLVAGSYQLRLQGPVGSYSLRLLDFSNATLITPGTPVTGALSPANETDLYRFTVTAGRPSTSTCSR
jgi:hypothetical protein